MSQVYINSDKLKKFINEILLKVNVRKDVADYVAEGLVDTSVRGVDSHGVRLFHHYIEAVKAGRINPDPKYKFERTSASTGRLNADHTFGHAAGMKAAKKAVELAKDAGTGHVVVYNSTHFGAAAYYALEIARHDMIGLCFTHADSLMKTYAGKRSYLGTNPICFAAPCLGEEPFCLDMATTAYNFNKIKMLKDEGMTAPLGIGADKNGNETTDPNKIAMLLPIGGYKGYGLGMMVEIFCSLLGGMPFGQHITGMYQTPISQKRYLAHFISAIRIDCFQDLDVFKRRLSEMINELRSEPAIHRDIPVQVPGDPEKKNARIRKIRGIPLTKEEFETFKKIAKEFNVELKV